MNFVSKKGSIVLWLSIFVLTIGVIFALWYINFGGFRSLYETKTEVETTQETPSVGDSDSVDDIETYLEETNIENVDLEIDDIDRELTNP